MKYTPLIFFLIFLTFSCKKKSPFGWEADYTLPIINDSLTISDLAFDSVFQVAAQGNYILNFEKNLLNLNLESFVGIPDTTLTTEFSLAANLSVPPGFNFINEEEENAIQLEPVLLKKVRIKEGRFVVELFNPYPTIAKFVLTLPDVTRSGVMFSETIYAPPGSISSPGTITRSVSLNGSDMKLTGISGGSSNKIRSIVAVSSDSNGPTVASTPQHVTKVRTKFESIKLDYAQGYFGQQKQSDTLVTKITIFDNIESGFIDFPNVSLKLSLRNSAKLMGKVTLKEVIGRNKNGTAVVLNHPLINVSRNINSATGSYGNYAAYNLDYLIDSQNSNIEALLENGISTLEVQYEFEINPNGNVSGSHDEVFSNEILSLNADFSMPLSLGLDQVILKDTVPIRFSGSESEIQKLQALQLVLSGKNAFLADAKLSFQFINENDELLFQKINSITVSSGINGSNVATAAIKSTPFATVVDFTKAEINQLLDARKMIFKALLNTPNAAGTQNDPVIFTDGQFISLKAQLNGTYEHEVK